MDINYATIMENTIYYSCEIYIITVGCSLLGNAIYHNEYFCDIQIYKGYGFEIQQLQFNQNKI